MMNNEEKILNILETLVADVAELKADNKELKAGFAELKADNKELKAGHTDLKSILEDTNRRVVIIENEHGKSLKALHDGYSLLYDRTEVMHNDILEIKSKLDEHDARITELEYERSVRS